MFGNHSEGGRWKTAMIGLELVSVCDTAVQIICSLTKYVLENSEAEEGVE